MIRSLETSVVIPCCNSERWLAVALDSVARQTHQPMEVLVIVDASSDGSERIAREHPIRPRVVCTEFRNAAATRNYGVSLATGKWIAFLDADDWWKEGHLQNAAELVAGSADVAYFGHFEEYFQASGRTHFQPPLERGPMRGGLTSDDFYRYFLSRNPGWPTSGMVLRARRFREVGGFDVTQVRRHDTELFARMVFGHTWAYNPEPMFVYRKQVEGSISDDRAACSYFRFLADQKIAQLYGIERARKRLRHRAAICMSDALRSPSARWILRESGTTCLKHLGWTRAMFYRAAIRAPGPCRRLQSAAVALKQSVRSRRGSRELHPAHAS